MSKVIGPLHSFSASGKIGSMVFGVWRGIDWVRQHFIPANPQSAKQINIRTALTLAVEEYLSLTQAVKDTWDVPAKGQPYSGYNLWMKTALEEYISQIGIDTTPTSLTYAGNYPGTFTWSSS